LKKFGETAEADAMETPMPSSEIRDHVDAILSREDAYDRFREKARSMTTASGETPSEAEIETMAQFARHYVEAVVALIDETLAAADREKERALVAPLMRTASKYFLETEDLIPDSYGLLGLLDDAYLAHRFIIRLSEEVEKDKGFPLLEDTRAESAPAIRAILGDRIAQKVDEKVEGDVNSAVTRAHIARLAMTSGNLPYAAETLFRLAESDRKRMRWMED